MKFKNYSFSNKKMCRKKKVETRDEGGGREETWGELLQ